MGQRGPSIYIAPGPEPVSCSSIEVFADEIPYFSSAAANAIVAGIRFRERRGEEDINIFLDRNQTTPIATARSAHVQLLHDMKDLFDYLAWRVERSTGRVGVQFNKVTLIPAKFLRFSRAGLTKKVLASCEPETSASSDDLRGALLRADSTWPFLPIRAPFKRRCERRTRKRAHLMYL